MTLIWAKQIENKRAIFSDDAVTVWQKRVSAAGNCRPKLREIKWDNYNLIIASCWCVKDIDLVINYIEAKLGTENIETTRWIRMTIQTALIEALKVLKDIWDNPQVSLIILETTTNTLFVSEEYWLFEPNDDAEIVMGSAEETFHNLEWYRWFFKSFHTAVLSDIYCAMPLYVYRDGQMYEFDEWDNEEIINDILLHNNNEDGWEEIHSETTPSDERGDYRKVYTLRSRSWLSSKEATVLWQNSWVTDNKDGQTPEES